MSQLIDIHAFLQLSDSIATAGQPTVPELAMIRAAGYEVVVDLALPSSTNALPNEQAIVESQGMTYIHIPVLWETPTLEDLDRFFATMQAHQGRQIFVHCAKNMRVSAFMYLYRVLCEGVSEVDARADLHRIGIPNETWQQFIDRAIRQYPNRQ